MGFGRLGSSARQTTAAKDDPTLPKGPGWLLSINGHHYVMSDQREIDGEPTGYEFLRISLLKDFLEKPVTINGQEFLMQDLGLVKPTIISGSPVETLVPGVKEDEEPVEEEVEDEGGMGDEMADRMKQMRNYMNRGNSGGGGAAGGASQGVDLTDGVPAERFNFSMDVAWMPLSFEEAVERRDARLAAEAEAAEKAAAAAAAAEQKEQ